MHLSKEGNVDTVIHFDALGWETPCAGVRCKTFQLHHKRMRLVEYSADFIEPDWCMKGHTGYVISGTFEIDFNGNSVLYNAGDGIYIPAGEGYKHKAKILSEKALVFLSEDI